MHPYLFGSVPTYLVTYVGGLVLFLVMALIGGKRLRVPLKHRLVAAVLYAVGMVMGAKVLYDVQNGGFTAEVFYSVDHYLRGGVWGGGLAFLLLAAPYGMALGESRDRFLDLVALSLPLPLALGKLGCAGVGCCHGCASDLPWAVTLEPNDFNVPLLKGPLHPTQLYDFALLVGIHVLLRTMRARVQSGSLLLWFLATFGAVRFSTEFLRGDSETLTGAMFTTVQWLCIVSALVAGALLWTKRQSDPR